MSENRGKQKPAKKAPKKRAKPAPKAPVDAAVNAGAPIPGRFQKGRSGNPGGRPKLVGHVRELAQKQTTKAINALVRVLDSKQSPAAAKVSAATALLDRGWGKPALPIGGTDELPPIRTAREMTDEEILAALQDAMGEAEEGSRHG